MLMRVFLTLCILSLVTIVFVGFTAEFFVEMTAMEKVGLYSKVSAASAITATVTILGLCLFFLWHRD